jgi:hypothetical protein
MVGSEIKFSEERIIPEEGMKELLLNIVLHD